MKTEDIYEVILNERNNQKTLWPDGENFSVGETILLMEYYLNLARNDWKNEEEPEKSALNNLRKATTVAFRCFEKYGCPTDKDVMG